jgi:uncharacterized membrane protein
MDGFFVIGALLAIGLVVGLPILTIMALVQIGNLRGRIAILERKLGETWRGLPEPVAAPSVPAAEAMQPPPLSVEPRRLPPSPMPAKPVAPPMPAPAPSSGKMAMEERLGSRVFVWVGGLALALAGAFLVKYSIDQGWLGPMTRCVLGGVLGVGLVVGSEAMQGRSRQIAQSLSAAGVAVLYASLFAAIALYALIAPLPGFLLLAALTAFAIALALRQGPFVGLLGLAGGFLTPAIVRTEEPNALGLFVFLFAMQAGTQVLERRRGWWWLAPIAVAGGLLWVLLWLADQPRGWAADIWPALFLLSTSAATFWSRRDARPQTGWDDWDGPRLAALAMAAGTVLVMAIFVASAGYDSTAWLFFGALAALQIAFARLATENEPAVAVAAAAGLLLLLAWPEPATALPAAEFVSRLALTAAIVGGIFAVGGFAGLWGARSPVRWALLSAAATGLYFIVAYARLRGHGGLPPWGLVSVALAGLHVLAAERVARYRLSHAGYNDALGAFALATCGLLALAIPLELEHAWIAVAWSLLLPAIAGIEARLGIPWLRRAAWVAAGLVLLRLLPGPWLRNFPPTATPIFNWILYGYGMPLVALAFAAWLFRRRADDLLVRAVEAGAIAIGFLLVTLQVHHAFHPRAMLTGSIGFSEFAGINLAWLIIALGLMQAHRRRPRPAYLWGARIVAAIASAGFVVGLLLVLNPLVASEPVGAWPLLNWLVPAYALPAALLAVLARAFERPETRWPALPWLPAALGVLALVMGFAFVSLETRHWFQGPLLDRGDVGDAENYAYSAVWLLYGIGLLAAGIRSGGRALRFASMAVIMLTVAKVFLLDAAGLSGLYRVASFFGLGVSLLGIGYAYQRFVFRRAA